MIALRSSLMMVGALGFAVAAVACSSEVDPSSGTTASSSTTAASSSSSGGGSGSTGSAGTGGAGGQFAHRAAQVQHARAPALRHGRGAQPGGGDGRGGVVGAAGGHGGHRPRQLRHPRRRPGVAPAPDGPA